MKQFSELSNLLPAAKARALRREYFIRLVTVFLTLATILVVIHGVLLIPAYLYAHAQVAREQAQIQQINESASGSQERAVNTEIQSVQADITYLGRLGSQATASGAVRAVLTVPHPGITISGFTYAAPDESSKDAQMAITGKAATRDALRAYVSSLGQQSYVSKADLPISAYAKDSDIPFTVTLTGSLKP